MKLFFAGSLGDAQMLLKDIRPKNILISYYYIRGSKRFEEINDMCKEQGTQLLIDSGAHTFFEKAGIELGGFDKVKFAKAKEQFNFAEAEQYYFDYLEFLKKYKITLPIELDIGALVGREKIREWRKMAKDAGLTIIPVWHKLDGSNLEDWEEMCKEYPYVGIEGGKDVGEYVKFLKVAEKHKTKVHAFAMTKMEFMRKLSFYSVDSTSWKSGSRFGATYVFIGNSLKNIEKEARGRFKNEWVKKGFDWNKIKEDNAAEVDKINAYAWSQLADSLDKIGVWKDDEKDDRQDEKQKRKDGAKNQADYFGKHKGSIQEKLKNPAVEERRRVNSKKSLTNFKTGKFSKCLPLYCNNCYVAGRCEHYQEPENEDDKIVCALGDVFTKSFLPEQFDYREEETVAKAKNSLLQAMVERLGRALHFEAIDGGVQDKSATTLAKMILDELGGKTPTFQLNKVDVNINEQTANTINILDDESRQKIIEILEKSVEEQGEIDEYEREFILGKES